MNLAYIAIIFTAIVAGFAVSQFTQRSISIGWRERIMISLGAFCGGMIGAKLPFLLADLPGLVSGHAWFADGKTIMFGLVGGYFGVEVIKWALEVRVKTGDSYAVPVAVAIGIGRLGCFTAGCCYGTATGGAWGVDFGDGILRHPTQVYESLFHLSFAAVLLVLYRRQLFRGQLIKLYFIGYFMYRFATEFIRPEPRLWMDLTGYQWATLALIPLFIILWIHDARQLNTADLSMASRHVAES